QVAVNLPILSMLSLYVYAGFLRAEQVRPTGAGLASVVAVTAGAFCVELGRKTTRRPRPGERTYASLLGASGTSFTALGMGIAATLVVLLALARWQPGHGWGWLVLAPLALPVVAVARFAGGALRWPAIPTIAYVPAMYTSFLVVGALTKGTFG